MLEQEPTPSTSSVTNSPKWYEKDTDDWCEDDYYEALEDLYETHH